MKCLYIKYIGLIFGCIIFSQCDSEKNKKSNNHTSAKDIFFAKGADVSWLPQMEESGYQFLDNNGQNKDVLDILKSKGINSIRLRVFVDPSNDLVSGHCSKKETIKMAQRASEKGFNLMLDFHYSDSWADPAKQNKPTAWKNHNFEELKSDVFQHTFQVLDTLKSLGIVPKWVQIGNEITSGMLWTDGKVWDQQNWINLAQLLNKGYEAVQVIDTSIKVIIHIDKGNSKDQSRWFFDNITAQNVKYDIIGFSYYPYWIFPEGFKDYKLSIHDLKNNIHDVVTRYKKPVMIVEIGEIDNQPEATYNMLVDVMTIMNELPKKQGLGVFYWEPQGAKSFSNYSLSAWDNNTRKPTRALDAFNIFMD